MCKYRAIMKQANKKANLAEPPATYRIGLLQSRAFRIMKQRTTQHLSVFDISPFDWALLGLLFDSKKGMRCRTIAEEIGVEAPFVTSRTRILKSKGLIDEKGDKADQRAKILRLTEKGKNFVIKIERDLRLSMNYFVDGGSLSDFATHIRVIELVIENDKKRGK